MKTDRRVMVVTDILLAIASVVCAQEKEWSFEVTPYFWAAGIEGDAKVQGRDVDIDVGFDDLFDAADAGGGLMTVAQRGSFVLFGQFDYVGLDTDELDPAPAGGSIQTDSFLGALAAGWQFPCPFKRTTIDVLGGIRYAWMNNELEITGVGSGEDNIDIVDGIFVVRPTVHLTERWSLRGTFDIGAGDSDLTWELQPSIQYQLSDKLALRLGYRRVHYDIEKDTGNTFDAAFQGVIAGVSLLF